MEKELAVCRTYYKRQIRYRVWEEE